MGSRLMPMASRRIFPAEWLEAGDDRPRLAAIAAQRRALDGPRPDLILARKWKRATTEIEGQKLHLLTPKNGSTRDVLFYCHGGAFVVGPSSLEWLFAAKVAARLGCDLALYEYPKVPGVDSATIRATTLTAWEAIAERYAAERMVIAGTSAGGGLAASTVLQLLRRRQQLPSAVALFSPWLDMTISHPDVNLYAESDRLLPIDRLRRDGELYAGASDPTDPLVSPRFASDDELAAMPPVVITAGEDEILLPEAREFVAKLTTLGVKASLVVEAHGQHAGIAGPNPEATSALADCLSLLGDYRRG